MFFLGVTVLATWPLAAHLSDGSLDLWDAKLNAWILHWDFHQLFRDPIHLFDANIFFPARLALAFSENLLGAAVFGFPMYAAGASTLVVYNVLFLLGMFLSALGAWALARQVTGDGAASLLAGVVYAFLPWRIDQIPHIQFQWGAFLPLLLLFLLRFLDSGRKRDLVLFAAFFAWNALANVHYAIFSGVLLALVLAYELLTGPAGSGRRVLAAVVAAGVAGLLVSPFLLPYAEARRLYGMERYFEEMEFYSGRLKYFLSSGSRNWLYGRMTGRFAGPEGSFFPGLLPVLLSVVPIAWLLRRRPEREAGSTEELAAGGPSRWIWARIVDAVLLALLLLYAAAVARPGLRLGFVKLGDPGRLVAIGAVAILLRLAIAFPKRFGYRDLSAYLRSRFSARNVVLFLAIGVAGVLIALGAHTPIYRFLFKSMGFLFRAIRAPARGIVLFHVALAVLSAWGLAILAGRRQGPRRVAVLSIALALTGIEYRAFPVKVFPVESEPAPIYRWLSGVSVSGGVMEWPLGDADFEYEFRSTVHWKPLINGSSGFFPPQYQEISALLRQDPIPDSVWEKARELRASVLILHPHDAPGGLLLRLGRAAQRGVLLGELEVVHALPHGPDRDYVFRLRGSPPLSPGISPEEKRLAAEQFAQLSVRPGVDLSRPFAVIDFPPSGFQVVGGEWAYGWAIDDSGIQEVRIASELGPAGVGAIGGPRPDVGRIFPNYPESATSGFGFPIPNLPPGPHTLIVTVFAKDGGQTVLRRPVRYR